DGVTRSGERNRGLLPCISRRTSGYANSSEHSDAALSGFWQSGRAIRSVYPRKGRRGSARKANGRDSAGQLARPHGANVGDADSRHPHWRGKLCLLTLTLQRAAWMRHAGLPARPLLSPATSSNEDMRRHALRLLGELGRAEILWTRSTPKPLIVGPSLAEDLGMRPLIAHCHLGLGKLYGRTGKREQAQEHLTTAMTMYREMGMTYWLEKAEREMVELA